MITIGNLRADDAPVLALTRRAACDALDALARAATDLARARWEHELAAWLADRRRAIATGALALLDVGEIAWTPERFAEQQAFVAACCARAADGSDALAHLAALIARHRRADVRVGRRWRWLGGRPMVKT